jgi:uncharacterized protein YbjT (DUF2867 family)
MRILLLGTTGFIGSAIARRLIEEGHHVTGLGRAWCRPASAPSVDVWAQGDLNVLIRCADWLPYLENIDVVINASGALQSGLRDNLTQSQAAAIVALVEACEASRISRFVQISAPGADADASTEFMRTKAEADNRLKTSEIDYVILRPGLVIGREAFGGTALIRALAAFPLIVPLVRGSARIQAVSLCDVVRVCVIAATGGIAPRTDMALVEDQPHGLDEIALAHRRWLGLPEPYAAVEFPAWVAALVGWVADLLGWLGWRSPLRSTAIQIMRQDVLGAPDDAKSILGAGFSGIGDTLSSYSSGQQDRSQARLFLLLPLIVASLAILWIGSGFIGLARTDAAASILVESGMRSELTRFLVRAGSMIDIALGVGILLRRYARPAALGMAAMTIIYMAGATVFRADLWLDPLGSMLKALPVLMLALVAWTILEER